MSDMILRNGAQSGVVGDGDAVETLPIAQRTALELLLEGKSVAETARSAGVARATVFRWLKDDPAFKAAYNLWHEEMEESCRSRLLMLTDKAAGALEKALEAGDAKAALQLLKGLGLIKPSGPRITDVEELKARQRIENKRRKAKSFSDDLMASLG
jgi:hypothetical protein